MLFLLSAQFETATEYNKDLESQFSANVVEFLNPSQVLDLFERVRLSCYMWLIHLRCCSSSPNCMVCNEIIFSQLSFTIVSTSI